jgi:TolB-like protein/DNA-binding winged helix-turn-helix (wHTH) protein
VSDDFRLGKWVVRPGLNNVSQNGASTRLEPKVMEVLVCLASQPGEPVSKEKILKAVWPDTFVSDDVLTRSISELRRIFGDDARESRIIETIPKRGYRLVAPVASVNGSTASTSLTAAKRREPGERKWKIVLSVVSLFLLCGLLVGFNVGDLRAHIFGANPPIHSLAVLPLKNLSDDPSQKYFASGMTEELITDLSQISALKVISRTSSEVYENTHKALPEIARELNVDAIIEGSVERSGNHARVTAQLIFAPEDKNLWARSYDRDLQDALAVQGTLANAIADEIRVQLSPEVHARMNAPLPVSTTVLDNYLQGNYYLHLVGRGSVDEVANKASKYFQQAIDEDPNFAAAYIGLGYAHAPILRGSGLMNPSPRDYEIRKAAAEKAVELDPNSSEAHDLLASIDCEDWKWFQAEEELRRAIALSPNRADAHNDYGTFLDAVGRVEEGVKEQEIAQELDPNVDHLSNALWFEGRYDESIQLLLRDLERQSDDGYDHYGLFQSYALTGKYSEAIKELEEAGRLLGFTEFAAPLNHVFKTAGFDAAIRMLAGNLEKLEREGNIYMPDILAEFYGIIGDKDRTFYWLEDAYRHKQSTGSGGGLIWLKGNPMYASLRSDPRYADLVRRIGLPK